MITRRTLLQLVAASPVALMMPGAEASPAQATRPLVLVELKGGNDGLNTVVPYADDAYYEARPTLAIPRDQVLQLAQGLGLHPRLRNVRKLFEDKDVGVVLGVGYRAPNRSHFRSIEIWETGTESHEYSHTGWLDDVSPRGTGGPDAFVFGDGAGPTLGGRLNAVQLRRVDAFVRKARRVPSTPRLGAKSPALSHLLKTHAAIHESASVLASLDAQVPRSLFARNDFGQQLYEVARLIVAGAPASVYRVSLSGFDTHAGQLGTHQRLLGALDDGLGALARVLRQHNRWRDTLVLTYSEFGRRTAENGSAGTDHGTAAPHFALGGGVKGGLYGKQPNLNDLSDRDLRFTTDYRRLYTTVVERHWKLRNTHFAGHKALEFV